MILCLETATGICSVALADRNGIVSLRDSGGNRSHAAMLTVLIGDVLKESNIAPHDLEAVAVSRGPGSYTGLRIGVSTAKGISFGASVPLLSIDTTLSMFHGIKRGKYSEPSGNVLFCPMLDARRMEVYYTLYRPDGSVFRETVAEVINEDSFSDIPEETTVVFFGEGAPKCRNVIKRSKATFADDFRISASFMQIPAYEALDSKKFEDVAYFEPLYLKDFLATTPRKNILGHEGEA